MTAKAKAKPEVRTDPRVARLASAFVVTHGRIEATVNMARGSVRFIIRDPDGLERSACEMFVAEWSYMAQAIAEVCLRMEKADEEEARQEPLPEQAAVPA